MKDLLRTEHLSRADVELLLGTAAKFAEDPFLANTTLANQTVGIYMTKPSTRTRLASETAVAHLGGTPVFLRGDDLQLGRGETISDTARIMSGFLSALIVRTFAQSDVDQLGQHSTIPVINALTDDDHPTQLLADWITIREKFGSDISGRKFTYIGDGNNMAHAWLIMGAILGAHVVAATPEGKWAPDAAAVATAKKIAEKSGAKIEVVHDAKAGAEGASVLYTITPPPAKRLRLVAKMSCLNPGKVTSSVRTAPPKASACSTTSTFLPFLLSSAAADKPLIPDPIIRTSVIPKSSHAR